MLPRTSPRAPGDAEAPHKRGVAPRRGSGTPRPRPPGHTGDIARGDGAGRRTRPGAGSSTDPPSSTAPGSRSITARVEVRQRMARRATHATFEWRRGEEPHALLVPWRTQVRRELGEVPQGGQGAARARPLISTTTPPRSPNRSTSGAWDPRPQRGGAQRQRLRSRHGRRSLERRGSTWAGGRPWPWLGTASPGEQTHGPPRGGRGN